MTRVLEQDTFDFWAEFGHRPGGGRGAEAGATWFRTGIPFLNYNGALALATLMTVAEGMKRGATVAILQATKDGLPVYQKLGFRATCSFRGWRIA